MKRTPTNRTRVATAAIGLVTSVCLLTLVGGCASAAAPKELVEARAAYQRVAAGPAAKLKPAELHVAKASLDRAEVAFGDDGDKPEVADLAYLALRKAELAESLANAAAHEQHVADLQREAGMTARDVLEQKEGKLKAVEGALEKERQALVKEKELTASEKAARMDAEKRSAEAERKAKDAMDALAKSLAIKDDARGMVITLSGGVLFVTGESKLLAGAQDQLNKVADALKTQAERHFRVEGHTDNQGTNRINDELSKRRAEAVRDYLIVRGVSADAITAIGLGSTREVASNKTPEGRAMNRRVEIIVEKP